RQAANDEQDDGDDECGKPVVVTEQIAESDNQEGGQRQPAAQCEPRAHANGSRISRESREGLRGLRLCEACFLLDEIGRVAAELREQLSQRRLANVSRCRDEARTIPTALADWPDRVSRHCPLPSTHNSWISKKSVVAWSSGAAASMPRMTPEAKRIALPLSPTTRAGSASPGSQPARVRTVPPGFAPGFVSGSYHPPSKLNISAPSTMALITTYIQSRRSAKAMRVRSTRATGVAMRRTMPNCTSAAVFSAATPWSTPPSVLSIVDSPRNT